MSGVNQAVNLARQGEYTGAAITGVVAAADLWQGMTRLGVELTKGQTEGRWGAAAAMFKAGEPYSTVLNRMGTAALMAGLAIYYGVENGD